jgi:hypothetical protein
LQSNKRFNDLEEDIDVTTTTLPGERAQREGLAVWREGVSGSQTATPPFIVVVKA